jgi:hypothetical protein
MPPLPEKQLFDHLTRSDELLVMNLDVQKQILQALAGLQPAFQRQTVQLSNLVNLKSSLTNQSVVPYSILPFDMTTAAVDRKVVVEGTNLVAATDGSLDGCYVRFNNMGNDRSPLKYFDWDLPFFELYVSWVAQGGKILYLAVGKQAGAKGSQRSIGSNPAALANELLYSAMPGASPVYSSMSDWRSANRIVLQVASTLDVACSIQVIGNITNATASATDINGPLPLAIGNVTTQYLSVGLAWDDWQPFIGIRITCPVLPAAGTVAAWAVQQA